MTYRRSAIVVGCVAVAVAALLARPQRFVVDGLSMAPGLMPDDVVATGWLPMADRLLAPRRFERWVVAPPEGGAAVKRIAGLPGEAVAIRDGDLVVDGAVVLKRPAVLAGLAVLPPLSLDATESRASLPPDEVLDDVPFAREVNRSLEPVGDVGLVARLETGVEASRVRLTLEGTTVTWRLPAAAHVWLIAGRLDGRLVAVAWRDREHGHPGGRCVGFPRRVPDAWSFIAPCPDGSRHTSPPRCTVATDDGARIGWIAAWRDVHLRPAADGTASWTLDEATYVMLGDFPTGSVDSRHWGPVGRTALKRRVVPRISRAAESSGRPPAG